MIKFREYINEGIGPVKTDYGLNDEADDKKIKHGSETYFIYDRIRYVVLVFEESGMGEVSFSLAGDFAMRRSGQGQAIPVLSRVFYVAGEMAKKDPEINALFFTGNDAGLKKLYTMMVRNKTFMAATKKMGYDVSLEDGSFIMRKGER